MTDCHFDFCSSGGPMTAALMGMIKDAHVCIFNSSPATDDVTRPPPPPLQLLRQSYTTAASPHAALKCHCRPDGDNKPVIFAPLFIIFFHFATLTSSVWKPERSPEGGILFVSFHKFLFHVENMLGEAGLFDVSLQVSVFPPSPPPPPILSWIFRF